jgi:pimeloyl-ACP methyl ester carboxylesterase
MAHGTHDKTLALKDGRTVGYIDVGDPAGKPIILFHGMPGSRLSARIFDQAASEIGARIICADRPGYSLSSPKRDGALINYVDDVVELADALGLERFAVMGVSGGGPYAAACAYQIPDRLTAAALVSSLGALWLPNSLKDMVTPNRVMFTLGRVSPGLFGAILPRMVKLSLPNLEKQVQAGISPVEELTPEIFAHLVNDQKEAVWSGGKGVAFDMRNYWRSWGFRFEDIKAKVYLWHGEADDLAPVALARYIADHIPDCEAHYIPGAGHTGTFKYADEILRTLVNVDDGNTPM